MTGQEMCEYIAETVKLKTGRVIDPKSIWESSLMGELFDVVSLYYSCCAWRDDTDKAPIAVCTNCGEYRFPNREPSPCMAGKTHEFKS